MKLKGSSVIIFILCIVIAACVFYIFKVNKASDNNSNVSRVDTTSNVSSSTGESYLDVENIPSVDEIKAMAEKDRELAEKVRELEMQADRLEHVLDRDFSDIEDSEIRADMQEHELRYWLEERAEIIDSLKAYLK